MADTFEEIEDYFYSSRYRNFVEAQHKRNEKNRHPERNRSTTDLLKSKKTSPEESIFQIGTIEDHTAPEVLMQVVTDFLTEMHERFGEHVHLLDWALHVDEGTPHIHERHVFDCENQYGEIAPQQEKALEVLGFELPDPSQKMSKNNNRKMVFDAVCRTMLFDICKKHGLHLEEEPSYGGRKYLEKQDYILQKQKIQLTEQIQELSENGKKILNQKGILSHQEQTIARGHQMINQNRFTISQQNKKMEEMTLKLADVDVLLDEVADVAYDKAVDVVADTVRVETHKEDLAVIENYHKWILSPERKNKKEATSIMDKCLSVVEQKLQTALSSTKKKIVSALLQPETKKVGKEQIKEAAKPSILDRLSKARVKADKENQERWEQRNIKKRNDMEL